MSEKNIGFCSGLKLGEVHILLESYRIERISKDKLKEYLDFIKNDDIDRYNKFFEYKQKVEMKTPNLKEIYYEFLDGKRESLDFELFSPY